MVVDHCDLPSDFDINKYELFQGTPTKESADHDIIDIGERQIEVLHTTGQAPRHLCFWERDKGYLFTGDLVYKDILLPIIRILLQRHISHRWKKLQHCR